jgi:thiamine-monophosphate kinase
MGARPLAAFVSIGLPASAGASFVKAFARGLKRALRKYGVSLGGGDTVRAEKCVIAVTLLGVINGKPVTRSGARRGDHIYISGIPGLSHLGLLLLRGGLGRREARSGAKREAVARHLHPHVDIDLGCYLRERRVANSMIDTSDGVFVDLGHLLEDSGAGATIDLSNVPVPKGVKKLALSFGYDWEEVALFGGEDYYLLFTVSPEKEKGLGTWSGNRGLYRIGSIDKRKGIYLKKGDGEVNLTDRARPFFEHFTVEENKDH